MSGGVLNEVGKRQNRYTFLLEIDGLENTYFQAGQAVTLPPYVRASTHVAQPGLIRVGPSSNKLSLKDAIAST